MDNKNIIFDPPAPIKPRTVNVAKSLVLKSTSSKERAKLIGQAVGPKSFIRTQDIHSHLSKAIDESKKINGSMAMPCESVIFDDGVKITDAAQIVNIDDPKSWDLINGKPSPYLGTNKIEIGSVEHDPNKSNLLLRGQSSDRVISEATTYINTAVNQEMIVNVCTRSAMPRSIAPVYEAESDSYILSVIKKKMGSKYRKNCLYVVKSNIFRVSDAVAAQRLYEYIESIDKDHGISKSALRQAAMIRKHVHELTCKYKGVDPQETKHLSIDYPYTDTTLGIVHLIFCLNLNEVPGYNHDEGSVFINNLDICVNIGLHQAPPIHPTNIVYENALVINPGYVQKCIPQVFTGYNYYVKELKNEKPIYAIVNSNIISIEPQQYPISVDADNEMQFDCFIRVFKYDKETIDESDPSAKLIKTLHEDIEVEQAIKNGLVYITYEQAQLHLDKFSTSLSVDLSKSRAEIAVAENKLKELSLTYDVALKKHQSLIVEIESAERQLDIKQKSLMIEHDSKIAQEHAKQASITMQAQNDLKTHEQKMESAKVAYRADETSGSLKVFAAILGTAAAGIGLAKAYGK